MTCQHQMDACVLVLQMVCSICHEAGHNKRTCGRGSKGVDTSKIAMKVANGIAQEVILQVRFPSR